MERGPDRRAGAAWKAAGPRKGSWFESTAFLSNNIRIFSCCNDRLGVIVCIWNANRPRAPAPSRKRLEPKEGLRGRAATFRQNQEDVVIAVLGRITYVARWAYVGLDPDLARLYAWLLLREHCVKIHRPTWGPHVSIVRSEPRPRGSPWGLRAGELVEVLYEPMIMTNGTRYWMPARFDLGCEIRYELGLPPDPPCPFHLTFGTDLSALEGRHLTDED
jgi:hypothetical protein